jgi:hypothetical protein
MTKTITLNDDELALLCRHIDYLIAEEEAELIRLLKKTNIIDQVQGESHRRFVAQAKEMKTLLLRIRSKLKSS